MKIEIEVPEGKELDHIVWKDEYLDFVPGICEQFCSVDPTGKTSFFKRSDNVSIEKSTSNYLSLRRFFNVFPSSDSARKASKLMRRSNAIIRACLLVDPDFEPDWTNSGQEKWGIIYVHSNAMPGWAPFNVYVHQGCPAYVSSKEKAGEAVKLLRKWGVK